METYSNGEVFFREALMSADDGERACLARQEAIAEARVQARIDLALAAYRWRMRLYVLLALLCGCLLGATVGCAPARAFQIDTNCPIHLPGELAISITPEGDEAKYPWIPKDVSLWVLEGPPAHSLDWGPTPKPAVELPICRARIDRVPWMWTCRIGAHRPRGTYGILISEPVRMGAALMKCEVR